MCDVGDGCEICDEADEAHFQRELELAYWLECAGMSSTDALVLAYKITPTESQLRSTRSQYSLDYGWYLEQLGRQLGGCAICGKRNENGKALFVDHDHACCSGGKSCGQCVRGLLCHACNAGIGHMRDNPETLRSAIGYLAKHEKPALAAA